MASMYVTIMDLPLFKGISTDHVSAFLEKTRLEFVKYAPGDEIHHQQEQCNEMRYVISGKVGIIHSNVSGSCSIHEEIPTGSVIGADRLFGMNTVYTNTAVALSDVCIMKFSKDKYLQLLASDEIYLMNILNYLSLRTQRSVDALNQLYSGSLLGHLAYWLETLTERDSKNIKVDCTIESLSSLTNISSDELKRQIDFLKRRRLALYSSQSFAIPSRRRLIEAAIEENSASAIS